MKPKAIGLPNGKWVRLAVYCDSWRALKTLHPDQQVSGWEWYPVPARDILARLRHGVHDRINIRGGIVLREPSLARIHRQLRRRVRHNCRWCGSPLGRYEPEHSRFCDASCCRSHSNL